MKTKHVKQSSISSSFIKVFRDRLRQYEIRSREVEKYLLTRPHDWGIYQDEFNAIVNQLFLVVMGFIEQNDMNRVKKLRDLFVQRYRYLFLMGDYNSHSLRKPFGYAGDFQIIDYIYANRPSTVGFSRLFDNYFQMSAISVAVRNRKEDFKSFIIDFIKDCPKDDLVIMNLASGPCREVKELFLDPVFSHVKVNVHCYDQDICALKYGKEVLKEFSSQVSFFQQNAIKVGLVKDVERIISQKYDFIYSTGLFDYFDHKITVRLLSNLRKLLKPGGCLAIANVREKHCNPSVYYMEWVGEWALLYKTDNEFRSTFIEAGFNVNQIDFRYEQQGILQYAIFREP